MARNTRRRVNQVSKDAVTWAAEDPVLEPGQIGVVSDDPDKYKIGDGVTAWSSLEYANDDHASSNGTDHTYIDQDVRTTASPTFAGVTSTSTVSTPAGTTSAASLNIGDDGAAPSSPANGDMWIASNVLHIYLNGADYTVDVTAV